MVTHFRRFFKSLLALALCACFCSLGLGCSAEETGNKPLGDQSQQSAASSAPEASSKKSRLDETAPALTVSGAGGSSPSGGDSVMANHAPVVESISFVPDPPVTGSSVKAVPQINDPDGDRVNVSYRWTVNGEEVEGAAGDSLGRPVREGDTVRVEVTADDVLETVTASASVRVKNAPPELSLKGQGAEAGVYRARFEARDPENEPVTFRLEKAPEGMRIDASTGVVEWEVPQEARGSFPVKVVARDETGNEAFMAYDVEIRWRQADDAPSTER